jgi:hypothetical protein
LTKNNQKVIGNVKSKKRKKEIILKPLKTHDGYFFVRLSNGDKFKNIRIHRLVALTFIKGVKHKNEVNHIDGDKSNNRVDNLMWCNRSENMLHAYRSELKCSSGELNSNSKLTKVDVMLIRNYYENGIYKQFELANIFKVSKHAIYSIIYRRTWKNI